MHCGTDGGHQIDVVEDKPLGRQQQSGEDRWHHPQFHRGIDLEILHMVDDRHTPTQSQPQAEQADEKWRGDEHDRVRPVFRPQATPSHRQQPTDVEAHAPEAGRRRGGDEVPHTFNHHTIDTLIPASLAVVAVGIRLWHPPPRVVRHAGAHRHLPAEPLHQPAAQGCIVVRDAGWFRPVIVGIDGNAHGTGIRYG